MFLIGWWHGASYTFALLGVFHGCALVINHAWRSLRLRMGFNAENEAKGWRALWLFLTFVTVTTSFVLFRAENMTATLHMYEAMFGFNGIAFPPRLMTFLNAIGISPDVPIRAFLDYQFAWTAGLLVLVFAAPNSQQILSAYFNHIQQADDGTNLVKPFYPTLTHYSGQLLWRLNPYWGIGMGAAAFYAATHLSDPSAFLYFNF